MGAPGKDVIAFIIDKIEDWIRGLLTDSIVDSLTGLFDSVNDKVGSIAGDVGATPQGWNPSIFSMIRNLSDNVMVPIAGLILAFVMTLELIQMITERNNLHNEIDTWMFFKWIFKTCCAIVIVTNTWNIVMGVFDIAQSVVNSAASVISGSTRIDVFDAASSIRSTLSGYSVGELLGLWFLSLFVNVTMSALSICIFIIVYGRMIEIYLVTSVAPIPMATMLSKEGGGMGQNYLRSLFALAFQGFLMPDDAERKGLGTPATRAAIIEKLVACGYVERKKDRKTTWLLPANSGVSLAAFLPEKLRSPQLTAEWETKLKQVERGEVSPGAFLSGIAEMVEQTVRHYQVIQGAELIFPSDRKVVGACPRCGSPITESAKGWFCESRDCKFALWRDNRFLSASKISLTTEQAKELLTAGKTFVKNIYSAKKDKTFDAFLCLSDNGEHISYSYEFPNRKR